MPFIRAEETLVPVKEPPAPQQTVSGAAGVPEINGSSSAFIALVVSLGVVVVICCVLVFVLLKWYNPTPYERQLRRTRRLQRKQGRSSSPHSALHAPSWLSKITRPFRRRGADGWVQASGDDGEEWDARDELPSYAPHDAQVRERTRDAASHSALHIDTHIPRSDEDPSADSVELQAPAHAEHTTTRYSDPFVSSPSPTSTELSDGPHTPKESREGRFSVQTAASSHHGQGSDAASIRSMRKFESGTKFKEALEF